MLSSSNFLRFLHVQLRDAEFTGVSTLSFHERLLLRTYYRIMLQPKRTRITHVTTLRIAERWWTSMCEEHNFCGMSWHRRQRRLIGCRHRWPLIWWRWWQCGHVAVDEHRVTSHFLYHGGCGEFRLWRLKYQPIQLPFFDCLTPTVVSIILTVVVYLLKCMLRHLVECLSRGR